MCGRNIWLWFVAGAVAGVGVALLSLKFQELADKNSMDKITDRLNANIDELERRADHLLTNPPAFSAS
jgi:FtsZ-binding cell division protein ZapB